MDNIKEEFNKNKDIKVCVNSIELIHLLIYV
jgi:hypothetical protein